MNLVAYVVNFPTNRIDPKGLLQWSSGDDLSYLVVRRTFNLREKTIIVGQARVDFLFDSDGKSSISVDQLDSLATTYFRGRRFFDRVPRAVTAEAYLGGGFGVTVIPRPAYSSKHKFGWYQWVNDGGWREDYHYWDHLTTLDFPGTDAWPVWPRERQFHLLLYMRKPVMGCFVPLWHVKWKRTIGWTPDTNHGKMVLEFEETSPVETSDEWWIKLKRSKNLPECIHQ